jgi:hypothetical protein
LIVWCLTPALAVFQLYRGVAQNIAGAKEDTNEYDWSLFPFFPVNLAVAFDLLTLQDSGC